MAKPDELFILYEPWQIDEAVSRRASGTKIVCLDFLIECELKKKNIPHISLRDFLDPEKGEAGWGILAQDISREWYRLPAMKFFAHEQIRIGEVVEPIFAEAYLPRLFYYTRLFTSLKKAYPYASFLIPAMAVPDDPTAECLISFERRIVVDGARMALLTYSVIHAPPPSRPTSRVSELGKVFRMRVYNFAVGLLPRRRFKIFAEDYWSLIGPVIERMDDTELVLTGSGELKHIPWRQLFKHRIRIRNPSDEISNTEKDGALQAASGFLGEWGSAKSDVTDYLRDKNEEINWSPVIEAFEYLMTYASRVIVDIDALRRILIEEKPNIILELASVAGRYLHVFILARLATQLHLPSVELQHAVLNLDPRLVFSRIETDYLATFGTGANAAHEHLGNTHKQLVSVGSPRFDRHFARDKGALAEGKRLLAELGIDTNRPVLFAAVPFVSTNVLYLDSYQLADFLKIISSAQAKIPRLQVLYKCRNNNSVNAVRAQLKEMSSTDSVVAGNQDVFALVRASDAVVCGNSTLMYQAMLEKKPFFFYPWKAYDTYNAEAYGPAAPIADSKQEVETLMEKIFSDETYKAELIERQQKFLSDYSFDGKSSERMESLLREIGKKKSGTIPV